MTFKALLLGSAAALATAGGAQAADLMADSVDYVKICDAFGSGYYYIPGSDTCLKFNGRFRWEYQFGDSEGKSSTSGGHMYTRADLNVTAAKMTSHGPLIGYAAFVSSHDPRDGGSDDNDLELDSMWLQWGHLTVGYDDSLLRPGGSYNFSGGATGRPSESAGFARIDWALGAHTLTVGIEDIWDATEGGTSDLSDEVPSLVAAITGSYDHISYKLAAGYATGDTIDSGFAVLAEATAKLDMIAKGDAIKAWFLYGEDAGWCAFARFSSSSCVAGDATGVGVSFRHNWSSEWQSNVTWSHRDPASGADVSEVRFNTIYRVGSGDLYLGPEVIFADGATDTVNGVFRIEWNWK